MLIPTSNLSKMRMKIWMIDQIGCLCFPMDGGHTYHQYSQPSKRKKKKMDVTVKNVKNSTHTPSPIKKMEPSFATSVESDGELPDYLSSLEDEVMLAASQSTVEIILLLVDKWEADIEREARMGRLGIPDLLNHYVRLKISLHHLKRAWDRGWSSLTDGQFATRANTLSDKVKEARRKY